MYGKSEKELSNLLESCPEDKFGLYRDSLGDIVGKYTDKYISQEFSKEIKTGTSMLGENLSMYVGVSGPLMSELISIGGFDEMCEKAKNLSIASYSSIIEHLGSPELDRNNISWILDAIRLYVLCTGIYNFRNKFDGNVEKSLSWNAMLVEMINTDILTMWRRL